MNEEIKKVVDILKEDELDKKKKIKCSNCKEVVIYKHKSKPNICPHCANIYWDKPHDEFILFNLQDKYFETGDLNYLGEIYKVLKPYAKKLIVKKVKNRYYFSKDELEMKAHDVANKFFMYYIEGVEGKPFKVEISFGGYANNVLLNVLYGQKKEDHDSLNSMIDDENEFMDCISNYSLEVRQKMIVDFEPKIDNHSNITSHLIEIVKKSSDLIRKNYSVLDSTLALIGVKNKIKGFSEANMDSYYLYSGINTKKNVDSIMLFVYKKLKQLSH